MRILHLAYEDPRQPGSGGGAVRAREINRRLSGRHEITALVAAYPGASPRLEDGVRWIPVGTRTGTRADRLAYSALVGGHVAARRHDLVVEEFGAPFSVGPAPLFTTHPIVASVQWLFAGEMREKYGIPFDDVERRGLALYDRFIAVSEWLAGELRRRAPGATIDVVQNGVDPAAFAVEPRPPAHLLYLGRLDEPHKGTDILVEALAHLRTLLGPALPPLVVVGDGPDEGKMRADVHRRGLDEHVRFRGRVDGSEKYELIAQAHAVLMPSRWETFGMVAAEALAVGVPVVAFDVGPLGEVIGDTARLVPPFDARAFAHEVVRLLEQGGRDADLRARRRAAARGYDWDALAVAQERVYLQVVESGGGGGRRRRASTPC
jgi:glycosyltransferase involved in cell wall biosynthesis